ADGVLTPSRRITLTQNTEGDWLAGDFTVHGLDSEGRKIQEAVAVTPGGNAVATTVQAFARVTQIDTPAGDGTVRTLQVGVAASVSASDLGPYQLAGVPIYDASREPNTATLEFAAEEDIPVLANGAV